MWATILSVLGTIVIGIFGVWWKSKRSVDPATQFGAEKQRNEAHVQNAEGQRAAMEVLDDELPEGKELLDALEDDYNNCDNS